MIWVADLHIGQGRGSPAVASTDLKAETDRGFPSELLRGQSGIESDRLRCLCARREAAAEDDRGKQAWESVHRLAVAQRRSVEQPAGCLHSQGISAAVENTVQPCMAVGTGIVSAYRP